MTEIIENLQKGQSLSFEESKSFFSDLMEGKYEEDKIIEILEAFIKKGETKVTKKVSEQIAFLIFFVIILGLIVYSVNDLLFR